MRCVVLGSAAGGGYPQWNCRCSTCRLFWDGDPRVKRRTQSSIAISANGTDWVLMNCSPDIREQIGQHKILQPRALRHSPIKAVVLTNGDIDHVGGLLSLRESHGFDLHGTMAVLDNLADNPAFSVLKKDIVRRMPFTLGVAFAPLAGLTVEAFAVPGKVPLYLEGEAPDTELEGEFTVGLEIRDETNKRLLYLPGCSKLTPALAKRIAGADCLFFDGTLWRDDEMIAERLGSKTGRRMGPMPVSGENGSIAAFASVATGQKHFIHINNTNPILIEGSPEAKAVHDAGWGISWDGMEVQL